MIKHRKYIGIALAALVAVVSVVLIWSHKSEDDMLPIKLQAIENTGGWGYEIYVDQKLFIKQDHIPALAGNKSFANQKSALLVGNQVISKMKQGKLPEVTTAELRQWGIQ